MTLGGLLAVIALVILFDVIVTEGKLTKWVWARMKKSFGKGE